MNSRLLFRLVLASLFCAARSACTTHPLARPTGGEAQATHALGVSDECDRSWRASFILRPVCRRLASCDSNGTWNGTW